MASRPSSLSLYVEESFEQLLMMLSWGTLAKIEMTSYGPMLLIPLMEIVAQTMSWFNEFMRVMQQET